MVKKIMINGFNLLGHESINHCDEISNESNRIIPLVFNIRNETTEESICEELYDRF